MESLQFLQGSSYIISIITAALVFGIAVGVTRASILQHDRRITHLEKSQAVIIEVANDIKWIKQELSQEKE